MNFFELLGEITRVFLVDRYIAFVLKGFYVFGGSSLESVNKEKILRPKAIMSVICIQRGVIAGIVVDGR